MKIHVKGYLTLRRVMGGRCSYDIELEEASLKSLMEELGKQLGDDFKQMIFDPETSQLNRHIAVMINGRHCSHLPDGLDTQLKDGDVVAIFPPIAGGLKAGY